jgi:hypothetical protein
MTQFLSSWFWCFISTWVLSRSGSWSPAPEIYFSTCKPVCAGQIRFSFQLASPMPWRLASHFVACGFLCVLAVAWCKAHVFITTACVFSTGFGLYSRAGLGTHRACPGSIFCSYFSVDSGSQRQPRPPPPHFSFTSGQDLHHLVS